MKFRKSIYRMFVGLMASLALMTNSSCDNGLAELNIDPNAINNLDPGIQFTKFQIRNAGGRYEVERAGLGYGLAGIQQFSGLKTSGAYLPGDKYLDNQDFASSLFTEAYENEYKDLADYLNRTAEDPEMVNYYAMGLIWKSVSFHKMTDIYGDVPYFNAGKGYLENDWFVTYDAQKDIYTDMLQGLEDGANMLTSTQKTMGVQDLAYKSDLSKWRKMAYSYMLRLGLRLVKSDLAMAEIWVKKAIAGGVMTSNDDTSYLETDASGGWFDTNPFGEIFRNEKNVRLSSTLIDWLKAHNDPRLDILGWVESGGPQKGLPNGLDEETVKADPSWSGSLDDYSQINLSLVQVDSPVVFMTYAEVELMLAEAAVRGWYASDPETHYNKAVHAAMKQWSIYGVTAPSEAEIQAYLSANPYNPTIGLEMIGEQYWVATFLNAWEGYANWRRTGFPVLTPVIYPGNVTNGTIPRRLRYPSSEYSINKENLDAAVSRQGPDNYTTRVWWDKE